MTDIKCDVISTPGGRGPFPYLGNNRRLVVHWNRDIAVYNAFFMLLVWSQPSGGYEMCFNVSCVDSIFYMAEKGASHRIDDAKHIVHQSHFKVLPAHYITGSDEA